MSITSRNGAVARESVAEKDSTVRVGVVGYGYWGPKHVRVLMGLPHIQVSVAEEYAPHRVAAEAAVSGLTVVEKMPELFDHVDALVIAAPIKRHYELAMAAICAGKHVLVEKPLASTSGQCEELIGAANDHGVTLMVGHTFEYNPAVRKLRDILRAGELGELAYIDTARLNLGIYRDDVNVVWDLAPHDISIMNYLLGSGPTSVSAWGRAHRPSGREDVACLQLEYEDPDVAAYVRVSWLDPCKVRRVTLVGSDKMVVYNDIAQREPIRLYHSSVQPNALDGEQGMPMTYHYGDIVAPYVPFEEPLAVQDRHFVDCIRTGKTPQSDGRSGLAVVRVLEAASKALLKDSRVGIADRVPLP